MSTPFADVVAQQAASLARLAAELDEDALARYVRTIAGGVVCVGSGKSFLPAQKLACTLRLYGVRAVALSASDVLHGDAGYLRATSDPVVIFSKSGVTPECVAVARLAARPLAITHKKDSPLAHACVDVLHLPFVLENGPYGIAPTGSVTAMMAVADALAVGVARSTGVSRDAVCAHHPANGHLYAPGAALDSV